MEEAEEVVVKLDTEPEDSGHVCAKRFSSSLMQTQLLN